MIELFHAESCPYCVKVRKYFEDHGVVYISKAMPLRKPSAIKDELLRLGGKAQVPYLVDPERNVKMYESDDIIAYVGEHYVK